MALNYISTSQFAFYKILVCVDSKSVLIAVKDWQGKLRNDIIYEIKFLIHCIQSKGIVLDFCWVPSHYGLYWNESVDSLAKQGASGRHSELTSCNLKLSASEINSILTNFVCSNFQKTPFKSLSSSRSNDAIIYKIRLNAWNTKYSKNITCTCSEPITIHHLVFDCPVLKDLYRNKGIDTTAKYGDIQNVVYGSQQQIASIAEVISRSPVGRLL